MPTITISKMDLESLLCKGKAQASLTIDEIVSLLPLVKGELKAVEGDELKIELADTNRPDLLSVEGIARQMSSHKSEIRIQKSELIGEIIVDPELKCIRPYIGGFVADGVRLTEHSLISIIQAQEKLAEIFGRRRENIAIGMYNAQKIKFPIFYRAVRPEEKKFEPLGIAQELNLREILEIHPKGKEYGHILEGYDKFPFLEDCNGAILSFPPIINSRLTGELQPGDTHIFCEVTGTNIDQLMLVVNIVAQNFKDRGANVYSCNIKYPYSTKLGKTVITPYEFKHKLSIEYNEVKKLLGKSFTKIQIKNNLEKMGYKVSFANKRFIVSIPPYRGDVMHPVDVIEDLALCIGYENFEPTPLEEFTLGKIAPIQSTIDKVRKIMIGCGFEEVMTNILTSKTILLSNMRLNRPQDVIEVDNPVSELCTVLRNSLIPLLLSVEGQSSKSLYPHKIFEIGEVVTPDRDSDLKSRTEFRVAGIIAHPKANFSELHSFLDSIAYYLNLTYKLNKIDHPSFIKGRVATIVLLGVKSMQEIGIIGEIHPEVLENFKIKNPVTAFELLLTFSPNNDSK